MSVQEDYEKALYAIGTLGEVLGHVRCARPISAGIFMAQLIGEVEQLVAENRELAEKERGAVKEIARLTAEVAELQQEWQEGTEVVASLTQEVYEHEQTIAGLRKELEEAQGWHGAFVLAANELEREKNVSQFASQLLTQQRDEAEKERDGAQKEAQRQLALRKAAADQAQTYFDERNTFRDEVLRLRKALHDLTPMGSEFVDNPDRCLEWIRRELSSRLAHALEATAERREAEKELEQAQQERDRYQSRYEASQEALNLAEKQSELLHRYPSVLATSALIARLKKLEAVVQAARDLTSSMDTWYPGLRLSARDVRYDCDYLREALKKLDEVQG